MFKVLCVSYPIHKNGKKSIKLEKVNKNINELLNTDLNWVVSGIEHLKTPNNLILEPCPWHSGACHSPGDINNPDLCYTDGLPEFGIWMTNYDVLDTCHIKIKQQKHNNSEFSKKMFKLIDGFGSTFPIADKLNNSFREMMNKRNDIQNQISIIEKKLDKSINSKDPEYLTLKATLEKVEEHNKNYEKSLRKTYSEINNKIYSEEEFLKNNMIEDLIKLEKAKNAVQAWYNSNIKKEDNQLLDKYYKLMSQLRVMNNDLKHSYETPFAYIYRMYLNLLQVESFMIKNSIQREYSIEKCKDDINWCKINLESYNEFLDNQDPMKIVMKVEKEQAEARRHELELKNMKSVQRIKNYSGFVVGKDGSIKEIETKEQVIIGSIYDQNSWRN